MNDIIYTEDTANITPDDLAGFFVGWPDPPSPETLLRLLSQSTHAVVARHASSPNVIGYVTALSDGVLFGYVSSLEVLPEYQGAGIGKQLMERVLARMERLYSIDLVCDPGIQPFYEKCGMRPWSAMMVRRRDNIGGVPETSG